MLLCIGVAGVSAAFFGIVNGDAFKDQLLTIVCGASLIYGYFTIHKTEKSEC